MTLAAAANSNVSITVYCHDCPEPVYTELDLTKLAERLGPDHGYMAADLRPHFRCSKCGSKNAGFLYSGAPRGNFTGGSSN